MRVERAEIKVVVFTSSHRYEGTLYTYKDARITDELNARGKDSITLKDVSVYPLIGKELLYRVDSLPLNKEYISHLIPLG